MIGATALWHWADDVELTAFEGYDGKPVFLRWQHNGAYVLKEELSRGDHVLFDADGWVLELKRPRQRALPGLSLALPKR